jgi:FAD/FMN-containing dehydrogenase
MHSIPSLETLWLKFFNFQTGFWENIRVRRVRPKHVDELQNILSTAFLSDIPIRISGAGHSQNTSGIPKSGEIWVDLSSFNTIRFTKSDTVSVGCGQNLWALEMALNSRGFSLPVINDGWPGPSVGGFVSAGGFGARSNHFGGFWENVISLTVLTGDGNLLNISRSDNVFQWLFGSMGQLCVIVEVVLKIIHNLKPPATYPIGLVVGELELLELKKAIAQIPDLTVSHSPQFGRQRKAMRYFEQHLSAFPSTDNPGTIEPPRYWYTLFVKEDSLRQANEQLKRIQRQHAPVFIFDQRFEYVIAFKEFMPPLLFLEDCSIYATGCWGSVIRTVDAQSAVASIEKDFSMLVEKNHYRRYVQVEAFSGTENFRVYFGTELYRKFRDMKASLDPAGILNRGSVFEAYK